MENVCSPDLFPFVDFNKDKCALYLVKFRHK